MQGEVFFAGFRFKDFVLQSLQGYDPSEFTFANGVFCDVKEKYVVMIVILVWMVSGVEKSIKPPQRCYLCVVSDVLFTLCSIRH